MLKAFSYFNDILKCIQERKKLPVDIIHLCGGRLSGKSYVAQDFVVQALNIIDIKGKPIRVDCHAVRNALEDTEDLRCEFELTLDRKGLGYDRNKKFGKYTLSNKNVLRIAGLHNRNKKNATKAGLSRSEDAEHIIIVVEEAFEVSEIDKQSLIEAVRGNKNTQVLIIQICNPWSMKSEYIAYLNKMLPFRKDLMIRDGQQSAIIEHTVGGIVRRELFHYVNWRVANKEGVLSKSDINAIMNSHNIDKNRVNTADYGLPGFSGDAIYAYLLNNITKAQYVFHSRIGGGVDVGFGASNKSGISSAHFIGITPKVSIDIYDEWTHDNKKEQMLPDRQATQIINFFKRNVEEYYQRVNVNNKVICMVRVDFSDKAFINMLRNEVSRQRLQNIIQIVPCIKQPIQDRVEVVKYCMGKGTIRINQNKCPNLMKEFDIIEWDDKKTEVMKRANDNDHSINSFEYAIEPELYSMTKDSDISYLQRFMKRKLI